MSDLTPVEKFNKAVESKQNVKDEPEVTIWTGSYSAKAMYGSFLIGALVTVLGIVALVMISSLRTSWGIWTVVAVLLLMWAYLLGVMAYRKMSRSYELTNLECRQDSNQINGRHRPKSGTDRDRRCEKDCRHDRRASPQRTPSPRSARYQRLVIGRCCNRLCCADTDLRIARQIGTTKTWPCTQFR
jgi:hypothetical protein